MTLLLPHREINTYGWLLIGYIFALMLWKLVTLVYGVGFLFLSRGSGKSIEAWVALAVSLWNLALVAAYAGILFRVREAIRGLWVLYALLLLPLLILNLVLLVKTGGSNALINLVPSIFLVIGPTIVSIATRPFWPSFRPFSEIREEGFSRELLRLPSDVEQIYGDPQVENRSPSGPPEVDDKPKDDAAWF